MESCSCIKKVGWHTRWNADLFWEAFSYCVPKTWKGDLREKETQTQDLWFINHLHPAAVPLTIPVQSYFQQWHWRALHISSHPFPCLVSELHEQKALLQIDRSPHGFMAISSFLQALQGVLMRSLEWWAIHSAPMAGSMVTAQCPEKIRNVPCWTSGGISLCRGSLELCSF